MGGAYMTPGFGCRKAGEKPNRLGRRICSEKRIRYVDYRHSTAVAYPEKYKNYAY